MCTNLPTTKGKIGGAVGKIGFQLPCSSIRWTNTHWKDTEYYKIPAWLFEGRQANCSFYVSKKRSCYFLDDFVVAAVIMLSPKSRPLPVTRGRQHANLLCPPPSPTVALNSSPLTQWCYLFHPLLSLPPPAFNLNENLLLQNNWQGPYGLTVILALKPGLEIFDYIF